MTRRERMEARLEKRRTWAAARERRAEAEHRKSRAAIEGIPFGQPILVGHHSEKRHRAAIDKSWTALGRAVESSDMAKHHGARAGGIEHQLETSIFSDDPDAVEALEAKARDLDADAERANAINKAWRKHAKAAQAGPLEESSRVALVAAWKDLGVGEALAAELIATALEYSWIRRKGPMSASYARANARRARQRIEDVKRQQARAARADAAGGVAVEVANGHAQVTFSDYPGRAIVDALKGAGYHWSGGSWFGPADKMPAEVAAHAPGVAS